ncbi:MAG TPA: hypothetical protein VGG38_03365 [Acidimicrobiales bacterium]|jgi:hypothetical protein
MRRSLRFVTPVLVALLVLVGSSQAGASSHKAAAKKASRTQQGHLTFWECPAKTTEMLVGLNTLTLSPGQSLNMDFIVRNVGPTACGYVDPYAGAIPGPLASTLSIGQCGDVGFDVYTTRHHRLFPGSDTVPCPTLGAASLAPDGTVIGAGSWNQDLPSGKRVAPGHYTLVVAGHFSFPLTVEAR